MKVRILNPEERVESQIQPQRWDLLVDLGRSSKNRYEAWSELAQCPIVSIYDFAQEIEDLRRCGRLLQAGLGPLTDRWGIDWWDVLSLRIVPVFERLLLVERLAQYIGLPCELHAQRESMTVTALANRLGSKPVIVESRLHSLGRRMQSSLAAFRKLDTAQIGQVIEDKVDRNHSIRRRFSRRAPSGGDPAVLLPSAYSNVSRMAVRLAQSLPQKRFLLVCARKSARLDALPPNVSIASLDPYFESAPDGDSHLFERWISLRAQLVHDHDQFALAENVGMLDPIESDLRWGLRLRNAWLNLFESQNLSACFCADDANPYTRIPLLLARNNSIPTAVCHHGALDCWMVLKTLPADVYLAKNAMELDYLQRCCAIEREKIVLVGPSKSNRRPGQEKPEGDSLVMFTEPYEHYGWRADELYSDLLPKLLVVAHNLGLKLIVKLHPFESIRDCRRRLRRIAPESARKVEILAGPMDASLRRRARVAVTVQSSVAVECATLGVPVFLCGWLRDASSGYVAQFEKFGIGHVLRDLQQLLEIPRLLAAADPPPVLSIERAIDPAIAQKVLAGSSCIPEAVNL
jgi:hypothetical protein